MDQLGDLALNGVGLRLGPYNRFDYSFEPFWYEGARYTSATLIPGLSPLHFAPDHAKLTNAGHLVAIELEEAIGRTSISLGSPFSVSDAEWASGVDDLSLQARDATTGVEDRYWIMVPVGGSNTFQLDSLAGPMQQYELEVPQGQCVPAAATTRQSQIAISALAGPATVQASENTLGLKLSDGVHQSQALNSPIGLKTMPKRNITAGLWPVKDAAGGGPAIGVDEAFRAELEAELDDIFGKQTNVFFDITLGGPVTANWDVAAGASVGFTPATDIVPGDGIFYTTGTSEKLPIITAEGNGELGFDINIYILPVHTLVAGKARVRGLRVTAAGQADREERRVWLAGKIQTSEALRREVYRTCAHEVGHILIENGHPNENGGAAPLPGVDWKRRLMAGGPTQFHPGVAPNKRDKLLVKQEWDAIAETAKAILDGRLPE